ncbi:MAG: glycosyltransferase, partial [bacterium]
MRTASIIIAAHNEEKRIGRCLDSLLAIDYDAGAVQIIVVDNSSNDATVEIVRSYPVTLVSEPRKGAAHARNAGIEQAHHEIIVFVDADAVVAPDWLLHLTSAFDNPKIGAVGGKILPINDTLISAYFRHAILGRYQAYENERHERSYATCNLAIRREWLLKEKFDPSFTVAEDIELTTRLVKKGCTLLYQPLAVVRHEHPSTIWEFIAYWRKWAQGRYLLCQKKTRGKVCFAMRYQIVTLYYLGTASALLINDGWALGLIGLFFVFLFAFVPKEFAVDRKIFLNLAVVPILNATALL